MKRLLLMMILILSFVFRGNSQDGLIVLHPIVGDTIDKDEKVNYLLFPEITDSLFIYCQINKVADKYYATSFLVRDSLLTIQLNGTEINLYKENIEKLNAYYSSQPESDSINNLRAFILRDGNSFKIVDIIIDNEKISNEARSEERLKEDAERLKLQKQGADPGGLYIDFSYIRKKKNK